MEYFDFVKKVNYEGEQSSNPFAFKFYDPDRVILAKDERAFAVRHGMVAQSRRGRRGYVRRRYG